MDALMIAINVAGTILAAIVEFQQAQQSVNKASVRPREMAATVIIGSWLFLLSLATLVHCQHRKLLGKYNGWLALPPQALILAIAYSELKNNSLNATLAPLPSSQKALLCFYISMATLCLTQMALIMGCSQLSPRHRRHDEHGNSRQSTHWRSLTFAWAKPILDHASVVERLQLRSLPSIWTVSSTSSLTVNFNRAWSSHSGLVLALFQSHRFSCYLQWVLSGTLALSALFTQIALLRLLQSIDSSSTYAQLERIECAVVFGLACFVQQMVESHLLWTSSSRLELPIRAQLSCKIFERCLQRHSHSTPASAVDMDASQVGLPHDHKSDGIHLAELGISPQKDERYVQVQADKSASQDVVSLVGVDAPRVAEFAARQHVFLNILITVVASLGLLFNLIGWIPTLIGILGPLLLMPLNAAASQRYAQCQSKLMAFRDTRLSTTKEALDGIRQIKFAGAEDRWQRKIMQQRQDELNEQRMAFRWTVILRVFWILSPILLAVLSLGSYAFIAGALNPAIAFTALATFSNLESALSLLPYGLIQSLDALSSCARIAKYLHRLEQPDLRVPGSQVELQNATIAWSPGKDSDTDRSFMLARVNCAFPSRSFSLVFGQSGTGKSLLLNAILGEAYLTNGQLIIAESSARHQGHRSSDQNVISPIAYVASDPWLEAVSVRDAVLFGSPYQTKRYNEVLEAVALGPDIEAMEYGDITNIGIQGLRLSGGQRLRLSLARALYSHAQTIVIDEMFSALDTRTAQQIAKFGVMGSLTGERTVIVASNQPDRFLSDAAYAVELVHGHPAHVYANNEECRARQTNLMQTTPDSLVDRRHRGHVCSDQLVGNDIGDQTDEHTETGHVPWSLYAKYSGAAGTPSFWTLALLTVGLSQAVFLARNFALAVWTWQDAGSKPAEPSSRIQSQTLHLLAYLFLYVAISMSAALLEGAKCWLFYRGSLTASEKLFAATLAGLLHAPLQWFSKTPTGRIQNRMSADCTLMDTKLPGDGHMLFSSVFGLLTLTVAALLISPLLIIPESLLMVLGLWYSVIYLRAARGTRRLDAVTRSPVLDLLSSCSLGSSTIRAFGKEQYYLRRMHKLLDDQIRASQAFSLVYQWMDFRMGMIGSAFVLVVALYVANLDIDPSLAGLVLTLALGYSAHAEEAISRYASLQIDMNAVERIVEYARVPSEDYSGASIPQDWPSHGHVAIQDLCASYIPGEPSVLKRITIDIPPGSRVGIVGRTGAGKSSFAQAMLRCLHFSSGFVKIDGLNIQDVPLAELRARICFVPQDPMLFAGTIRYNLDPSATLRDSSLNQALQDVGLARDPASVDTQSSSSQSTRQSLDLDFEVTERGQNLSQSQCQLICLARGLARDARIVILDEATSSVDADIEDCIQTTLRSTCGKSTLIIIAHRLSTVLDLEQVAVMDAGRLVECGAPKDLYKARGAFHDLIQHSPDAAKLRGTLVD
ncbi:P-loop containing nucleoside triphosphate hydrolase protein [Elsinoe ampelina]|uniref:P-loop containing nucleoside triphosphate hydrolase protein n=1 Tax=Elsinoe ampelina TaxID=302913 RepID=A0A6A6GE47_9PEZI|nr:P-loop containing nucleoside triphosphate hydrolase protein [Elsinoe ampelina]